jgi:DNA-binding NarL/FixJ family response regulator
MPVPPARGTNESAGTDRRRLPPDPVRVFIVDHSELVRVGIEAILADQPWIDVVGAAATAAGAHETLVSVRPNVVLVDADLPDDGARELLRSTHDRPTGSGGHSPAVVVVASSPQADRALDAFAMGACGYLAKDVSADALLDAIRRAAAGEVSVDPVLGAHLLQALAATGTAVLPSPDALTPRELEVLRLLATGRTNKEIASQLIVALGTVKIHVERILSKLGSTNRSEAAVRAIELGLVKPGREAPGRIRANQ